MRHIRRRLRTASPGQAIPLLALSLVVLCGMLGLAVDVGILAHRNTVLQDAADSAANTGAHVLIFGRRWATPVTDADVWYAMSSTLKMANLTVVNANSTPPPDPCSAGYGTNQVALSATYLDMSGTPITNASGTPITISLATSTPPATPAAWRVKLTLGACQPAAFGGVIGHPRYTVRVDGAAGQPAQGPTNTPTITPSVFSSVPFYIYGSPQSHAPTQMLFAAGASGGPSSGNGDLVTLYDGGGGSWADNQYKDRSDGISGSPDGIHVHDDSEEGCLDPSTTSVTYLGTYFNHGGNGNCAASPALNSYVQVPVVDEVTKHGSGPDPCADSNPGGYCVQVVAVVTVHITVSENHKAQGFITGVVYDPQGIVAAPPPTPTNTPVVG
jgi:Flp pilus assembly protein TadG